MSEASSASPYSPLSDQCCPLHGASRTKFGSAERSDSVGFAVQGASVSNAKQLLAMLRSRAEGDDDAFYSIALQIAASEARQGHRQIAEELRAEVDKARAHSRRGQSVAIPFASPRGSLEGLLELRSPRFNLNDVVLNERLLSRIEDVLRQQRIGASRPRHWSRTGDRQPRQTRQRGKHHARTGSDALAFAVPRCWGSLL